MLAANADESIRFFIQTKPLRNATDAVAANLINVALIRAAGKSLTCGELVDRTGLTWDDVDAGLSTLRETVTITRYATHPERFGIDR